METIEAPLRAHDFASRDEVIAIQNTKLATLGARLAQSEDPKRDWRLRVVDSYRQIARRA